MKELIFLLIALFIARYTMAQTAAELLEQNNTQLKYMAEQIAALRGYTEVLQEGYEMVGNGLDTIGAIKQEDLAMHARYFNSLETVSPAVADDERVARIRAFCKNTMILSDLLPAWNKEIGLTMASNLESACQQDVSWLNRVVASGYLQLEDEQRLVVIEALYERAKARYDFTVGVLLEFGQTGKQVL